MLLYWLDPGMFAGHIPDLHGPALAASATDLYARQVKKGPYQDHCFSGTMEVESSEGCLGGIAGFVFAVHPSEADRERGARPGRFLIPHRHLEENAAYN